MAGKITIVEAEHIVEAGALDPNDIHLPGVYVDRVIKAVDNEKPIERMRVQDSKGGQVVTGGRGRIMRRAAKEFKDGMYVNLGIGMPTMVSCAVHKTVHFDSGVISPHKGVCRVARFSPFWTVMSYIQLHSHLQFRRPTSSLME